MRTVPILAGGILLVLAFGTATAVAATNESTQAEAVRVAVDAAPEPTVDAAPVVVVAPVETTAPDLTWSAPTAQPAPEPPELQLAPGFEMPTAQQGGADDTGWTEIPAAVDAHCTDVVPQEVVDRMWSEQGRTLYGTVLPAPDFGQWQYEPEMEAQVMAEHWVTACTWVRMDDGHIQSIDFGEGLDAEALAYLGARLAEPGWTTATLSTGEVLHIDAPEPGEQFPTTQAWIVDGDRWVRIHMTNDTDVLAFAETIFTADLAW